MYLPTRAALLLVIGLLVSVQAIAEGMSGQYDALGTTPEGKGYKGVVEIVDSGRLQSLFWKLQGGATYEGIGIQADGILGSAYGPPGSKFGLFVYRISGGTLDGVWGQSTDLKSELGRETLQGSAGLNGPYSITLGQNRDGITNYGGEVVLQPNGDNFVMIRTINKKTTIGVGVRINDVLVVATGVGGPLPGVVAYEAQGSNSLSGIWSYVALKQAGDHAFTIVGSKKLGTERLIRAGQ